MDLKKRTFEDLIGNFADDAKKALDEILEREGTTKTSTSPPEVTRVAAPVGNLTGTASGAVGGLVNAVSDLNETVGSLASLPEQVARLSALIEQLLPAITALTGALGTPGNIAGTVGKVNPTQS